MKRWHTVLLAGLPGAALAVAALVGFESQLRDLPTYFFPLRERTASIFHGEHGLFWNPDTGCGEPYLANPQTGVLYPPTWLAVLLPEGRATTLEAGLHLAILGIGTAMLAGRLGASRWASVAAAWGVTIAGPVVDAVGVINNLDTLAWLPWLWHAALAMQPGRIAVFTALAYLAAEPALAAIGVVIALLLVPSRKTLAGLVLGAGLVAVQAIPFAFWVAGGDRGPASSQYDVAAGAVAPTELAALVVPGIPLPAREARFVTDLATPLWVFILGAVAVLGSRRAPRVLAIAGWFLTVAAVVPSLASGAALWSSATQGLIRYPGRLLFAALAALAPAAAASLERARVRRRVAAALAAALVLTGIITRGGIMETTLQAGAVAVALTTPLGPAALLAGAATLLPRHLVALRLARSEAAATSPCLEAQRGSAGRVFVTEPSTQQLRWITENPLKRGTALGWGYASLGDGRRMVRTFAPLQSRALTRHLSEADQGPPGRWWLDTLAASVVVAPAPLPGFPSGCRTADIWVGGNPSAWPEASVLQNLPMPGAAPVLAGSVIAQSGSTDARAWQLQVEHDGAYFVWLATPDRGWRVAIDGRPAAGSPAPGIVQAFPVPKGTHRVTARYRPPGLVAGFLLSALSLAVLVGVLLRSGKHGPQEAVRKPESARTACYSDSRTGS